MTDKKTVRFETTHLLKAKLYQPRITRDLIIRDRLIELLNRGLNRRMTLVSAPAGFGKTTLISSWLKSISTPNDGKPAPTLSAWLSLDEHDSDLAIFLSYLIEALRKIFPDACPETLAMLRGPHQLPKKRLYITLNNELEALPGNFILVLDDYHSLSGQDVNELISDLIIHWPRPMHLVLISRFDPPLPLASLRAKDKLTEIRVDDLRFNTHEVAEYLDQALEIPLGETNRILLEKQTEGWIAALRLATLSLRDTINVEKISPDNGAG